MHPLRKRIPAQGFGFVDGIEDEHDASHGIGFDCKDCFGGQGGRGESFDRLVLLQCMWEGVRWEYGHGIDCRHGMVSEWERH